MRTKKLVLCGLFAALTAIGAFIQIPVPYMDYFTLQFLFVILSGLLLGSKNGAISITVYVLIGLFGIPIFAGGGGIGYIFKPSFGYLLGFIAAAWFTGYTIEKLRINSYKNLLIACFSGLIVCYVIGLAYKYLILNLYLDMRTPLIVVLLSCFPLDLPGDIVLCFLGAYLAQKVKPFMGVL